MKRQMLLISLIIFLLLYFVGTIQYKSLIKETKLLMPSNVKLVESIVKLSGHVTDYDLSKRTFTFSTHIPNNKNKTVKILVRYEENNEIVQSLISGFYHYDIYIDINQRQFIMPKNPNSFDYDLYLFAKGVTAQYFLKDFSVLNNNHISFSSLRLNIRRNINNSISKNYSKEVASFIRAFLLSDKSDFEAYSTYKDLGLAHIFAISGLHFGMIYQMLLRVIIAKNRAIKMGVIVGVMAAFLFLIGPVYSAQRAFIMILYAEFARIFHVKHDLFVSIGLASLIILFIQPVAALSSAYQLSFYAYICVAILYRKLFSNVKVPSKVLEAIKFSIFIQVLLIPASLYYFKSINVFSFLANLFVVPIVGILLPFVLLQILFEALQISCVSMITAFAASGIITQLDALSNVLPSALVTLALFRVQDFIIVLLIVALFFLSHIFWKMHLHRKKVILLSLIFLVGISIVKLSATNQMVEVTFFDVGHGDFSLIKYQNFSMLIDTGDGKLDVSELLVGQGVTKIDVLLLSHAHSDHIGGVLELVNKIQVDCILVGEETYASLQMINKTEETSLDWLNRLQIVKDISRFNVNKLNIKIYPINGNETNDRALITEIMAFDKTGYFMGDVSNKIIETFDFERKIDFIKIPHHGSSTSASELLYNNHKVDYGIISCNQKYNMPSKDLLDILNNQKVKYFTTYNSGAIQMRFNKNTINFTQVLD